MILIINRSKRALILVMANPIPTLTSICSQPESSLLIKA